MRLLLLKVSFLLSFLIPDVVTQFYRGELEPRYSRKTPFRQQTDIPDPVFGIGHGIRRFNGDKSLREEQPLSPFFGERREPGRRNSGREDGRDYEENGENEDRFGKRRPFGFGARGPPEEEEGRDGSFPREGHDFKRPHLPDPSLVKERFDKERKDKNQRRGDDEEEGQDHSKPSRERERSEDQEEDDRKGDEEEEERRPRRPPPRNKNSYEEEENEDHRRNFRPRHEHPDRPRPHHDRHETDQETENIAETPSKVVGLNMQMVAGVYPKEKKGPVVEDVDKRGGRFVDKPDEREQNKFFRGSEPEQDENRTEQHRDDRREQKHEEPRDRRPARGDSGESKKGSRGENSESGDRRPGNKEGRDERRREGRDEETEEQPHRGHQRGPEGPPQQQQQQAPPPPKPQIPPFPAFPKFPSFGGFQPFQPDFPTRSFGGNGGFAGGPWNESGRPSGRETAPGEDVGSGEDRSGQDGRRVHQQNTPSTSSDDSSAHDDSSERRHSTGDHSKEDERGRKEDSGKEHSSSEEDHREEAPQTVKEEHPSQGSSPRKEFPTPGRFVTNIRAKKSGEIPDATTAPSTTSTSSRPAAITFLSTTTPAPLSSTGIVLPTETIVTKLRSIVNQRIKVA